MIRNLILTAATMMGLARAEVKPMLRMEFPNTGLMNSPADPFNTKSARSRKRPIAKRGRWSVRIARLRAE